VKDKLKGVIIGIAAIAALALGGAAIAGAAGGGSSDGGNERDQAISGPALEKASAAALESTGGGKITGTELGDEDSYYQVEVTRADGSQVDVQLDRSFNVVGSKAEHEGAEGSEQGDHEQGQHEGSEGSKANYEDAGGADVD
jgi:hypothetical protein